MNTFTRVAAVLALSLPFSAAMAQSYAGVVLALTEQNVGPQCGKAGVTKCDDGAIGVKLFAGNDASGNSLEAAYIDFGKAKPEANGAEGKATTKAVVVAGVARFAPLAIVPDLRLSFKVGAAGVRTSFKAGSRNVSDSHPSLYLGASIDMPVYDSIKLVAAYDHVEAQTEKDKFGVSALSLGAQMSF